MRKFILLLTAIIILGCSQALFAVQKDMAAYENLKGCKLENLWLTCCNNDTEGWEKLIGAYPNQTRTATILGDKIYIASSSMDNDTEGYIHNGSLIVLDLYTGERLSILPLTVDSEPLNGLLCANTVDVDDFGNLYVAGVYVHTYNEEEGKSTEMKLYTVDPSTGACTIAATVAVAEDEAADSNSRIDYWDVCGDITRKKARCVIMAAPSLGYEPRVFGWVAEQGSDEFTPHMNGGEYTSLIMDEIYPEGQAYWGAGTMIHIVSDEEYSGDLFYVDGNNTIPTLYNTYGEMVSSMGNANNELWPSSGANGVCEFKLGDQWFIAYPEGQYDAYHSCQIYVNSIDEDLGFESMEYGALLPKDGLGQISDGGTRIHSITTKVVTDKNGKQGAYILTYKCANGVGVYLLSEEGFDASAIVDPVPTTPDTPSDQYIANGNLTEVLKIDANTMSGIQFDVEVPQGVEFAISSEAEALMSVDKSAIDGGKTRFIAYTKDGKNLPVDFICTATADKAERGTLKITNIILSVGDEPVKVDNIVIPVLGYALSGLTLPEVKVGESLILNKPEELNYSGISVAWKPYSDPVGTLTEDGLFTALTAGTIEDLGLTISDPIVNGTLDATAIIRVTLHLGDVDGSGTIDVADIVAVVNYILQRNPEHFFFDKADLDKSGDINIADLTRLVKLVLAQNPAAYNASTRRAPAHGHEVTLNVPASLGGERHIYVGLNSDKDYTAMQLDLELSNGLRIDRILAGEGTDRHTLDFASVGDNTTRILLYSHALASLNPGERVLDIVLADGEIPTDAYARTTGVISADADGQAYSHNSAQVDLNTPTGVEAVSTDTTVSVLGAEGRIEVRAAADATVRVLDIQGRIIGTWLGDGSINVAPGVYVVTFSNHTPIKIFAK